MKKVVALFLVAGLLSAAACGLGTEGTEACVQVMEAFTQAVSEGDFETALGCFSTKQEAGKFDYVEQAKAMHGIPPVYNYLLPAGDEGLAYLNEVVLHSTHAAQLKSLVGSLLVPEQYATTLEGYPYMTENDDEEALVEAAREMAEALDSKRLSSLTFVRMDLAEPDLQFGDARKLSVEGQLRRYGFDERVDYFVLYAFDGKHYYGGVTMVRFGDEWGLSLLFTNMVENPTPVGGLKEITPEAYAEMVED